MSPQINEAHDFFVEDAVKDSIGDSSHFEGSLYQEQNGQKQRRSNMIYKNNAVAFLYEILGNDAVKDNLYIISLSTGVVNDNNVATHDLLKKKMGLNYKNIRPSRNPKLDDYSLAALDAYVKMGKEAVSIHKDIIHQLKRNRDEKVHAMRNTDY